MPDRPTPGGVETRSADAAAPTVEGRRLRGLIPYGVESRDLGGWREVIEPGALREAHLEDLVCTVDHAGIPLGRHPDTLAVEDRSDGFAWSVELPESRSDVREAVERRVLRAGSWRMVVATGGDRWEGNVRHVERIAELRDVAVVTTAAYPAAAAEYRHAPDPPAEPPTPKPEEPPAVADTPTPTAPPSAGGSLRVEDRAAGADGSLEARVLDAIRSIPKGEARDLTRAEASAGPVTPDDARTMLWDRLRDAAVVLQAGVPVITTDRKKITWPRIDADMTAAFLDELEEIPESDPGFDEFEVEHKALKALVRMSAEAEEDSAPELLTAVRQHLGTILALRLDREFIVGGTAKGFPGLLNLAGVTIDAENTWTNYDLLLRAAGAIIGNHANAPLTSIAHPWSATAWSLLKDEDGSNRPLARPEGVPPTWLSTQIGRDGTAGTSSVLVFPPSMTPVIRRRDVTIEVDRSQEFTSDAVLVRGKTRAGLFVPYPQVVVKIVNVPAPDPTVIP